MREALISLKNISKSFGEPPKVRPWSSWMSSVKTRGVVYAVDNASLSVHEGEVLALVGESGCGKSTLGRVAVGLHQPTSGQRLWKNQALGQTTAATQLQTSLKLQMVFQDHHASLNPRMRVGDIVTAGAIHHGIMSKSERLRYAGELLVRVGLDASMTSRFPHQFSGGQRARINIARALALRPEFIVCDEAVAALDVSVQAQVLNLFMDLREKLELAYLFISHDLGVVYHISDRVAVMYLGRIVEQAATEELFARPNHPYTKALVAAVPMIAQKKRSYQAIDGEIPSPLNPPRGCHFHPRCPSAKPICREQIPELREVSARHWSACHLNNSA